jgi:hypothetical protein
VQAGIIESDGAQGTDIPWYKGRAFGSSLDRFTLEIEARRCSGCRPGSEDPTEPLTENISWQDVNVRHYMPGFQERRLLQKADLVAILQLTEPKIQWLIDTHQLRPLLLCGEERFDSKELDRLISTYQQIAERKNHDVQ